MSVKVRSIAETLSKNRKSFEGVLSIFIKDDLAFASSNLRTAPVWFIITIAGV